MYDDVCNYAYMNEGRTVFSRYGLGHLGWALVMKCDLFILL